MINFKDLEHRILERLYKRENLKRRLSKDYEFINRSKDKKKLLIILAGYQEFYWNVLLERVNKYTNNDVDICVVIPGSPHKNTLKEICEKYNWSYLYSKHDRLGLVQNIAINLHPNAEFIIKIDEDIVVCKNYFENMIDAYNKVKISTRNKVGIVAPLINVNGYSYIPFLESIDKIKDYDKKFGRAIYSCTNEKVHLDSDAAIYLWENSIPFDKTAELIKQKNNGKISICPHRYSIGMILFKRSFWEEMNMFEVGKDEELGLEERQICEYCNRTSQVIVIAEDVFIGHLGFGKQKDKVKQFFFEKIEYIRNTN